MSDKSVSPRSLRVSTIIKWCFTLLCCIALLELASWWFFHHRLYAPLRDSAIFSAYGTLPGHRQMPAPKIQPYLWANYMPNPHSPEANAHGWRYGGGPKEPGIFRILCIGGSTTWSDKASGPQQSYPAQLETFLRFKGFSVDVVNGGCGYFTSAELVGTLAFRGIYTDPDLVIIHTGGNDGGPLKSPRQYRPDYTHWRTVDPSLHVLSKTDTFRAYWKIPSWTWRLYITLRLRPNAFYRRMVATQLDSPQDGLVSKVDLGKREHVGLERNLRTLIAISRAHGAKVATVTFGTTPLENLRHLLPQIDTDSKLRSRVFQQAEIVRKKRYDTITRVSDELGIPVIPFHDFVPSSPERWVDQCHLDDAGCKEKGQFIGRFLVETGMIPEQYMNRAESGPRGLTQ